MSNSELSSTYALILAGGSGTRFWPVSRSLLPKQLLPLFGDGKILLELTVLRLNGLIAPENILLLTNSDQEEAVREAVGDLVAPENIISEPEQRDTAPAIALAVAWVSARNPEATMMVLPSDHLIRDVDAFRRTMRQAVDVACREDGIVTIGIEPTWPCPTYGYIQKDESKPGSGANRAEGDASVCRVGQFREKPNARLAEEFLEQGNFSWNTGIFVWRIPTVVRELQLHCPELAAFIGELQKTADFLQTVREQFAQLPKISIDYALMEKASNVLNIEACFDWDDLGSWVSAGKYFSTDVQGNACNSPVTPVDSANNIVYTDGDVHVALLGVDNIVLVQTPDAILVAAREAVDQLKDLVEVLPSELK